MDRGAARSKKRAAKNVPGASALAASATAGPSSQPQPTKEEGKEKEQKKKFKVRIRPGEQSTDPSLYRAKAIRNSSALIYSESPFELPPAKETLEKVRRVDLSGSGITDVQWLSGTGVTWLSIVGCQIENGWEAIGSLSELTVLNISGCGLKSLPPALGQLKKLKALVAMNNDWNRLDEGVVGLWTELNSLIISHSPNLISLPSSLASLHHLSKLTFSHCPRLGVSGLPDLSSLPLLRDVKMNNLPLLTTLPAHISNWGKGDLSLASKTKGDTNNGLRKGDGLEVLDLGNCSLPFTAITLVSLAPGVTSSSTKTKSVAWPHLRSLSLHTNPLTTTHPNYVELLQSSKDLPNLQIIDTKRVVERKRKGEISESKHDKYLKAKKERGMRPSGSNAAAVPAGGAKMRQWGGAEAVQDGDEDREKGEALAKKEKKEKRKADKNRDEGESIHPHKKRRHDDGETPAVEVEKSQSKSKKRKAEIIQPPAESSSKVVVPEPISAPEPDHTIQDKGKTQTAVVGVIDIRAGGEEVNLTSKKKKALKAKLKKSKGEGVGVSGGGIDLRQVFAKPVPTANATDESGGGEGEMGGSGLGLGVGGW